MKKKTQYYERLKESLTLKNPPFNTAEIDFIDSFMRHNKGLFQMDENQQEKMKIGKMLQSNSSVRFDDIIDPERVIRFLGEKNIALLIYHQNNKTEFVFYKINEVDDIEQRIDLIESFNNKQSCDFYKKFPFRRELMLPVYEDKKDISKCIESYVEEIGKWQFKYDRNHNREKSIDNKMTKATYILHKKNNQNG